MTTFLKTYGVRLLLTLVVGLACRWLIDEDAAGVVVLLGNTFATPDMVLRKVARRLTNNARFAGTVMRDYDDEYRTHGVKKGDSIRLRLPQRYEVTVGAVMTPTPLTDQTVTLAITDQTHVGFEYDSWAATMEVDDYMERYANPAVDQLVNNIDFTGLQRMYREVGKTTGTPGTVPTTNTPYTLLKTKLVEAAVPRPYNAVLTADMHAELANANIALFNPSQSVSAFFRTGQFSGPALGIDRWFEDENVATHTVGALGGTPLVMGAGQVGSSVIVDGASASIAGYLKAGDAVQFATVNDINPLNHQSTGRLKDWALAEDAASTAGGLVTLNLTEEIITSGPFQTCSNAPGNNDALTIFGHASAHAGQETRMALVYHKEAFALVMADLILPKGLWVSERISNAKLGISIRMLKDHDILNDVSPARLDTAHGWKAIRQTLAGRVCS